MVAHILVHLSLVLLLTSQASGQAASRSPAGWRPRTSASLGRARLRAITLDAALSVQEEKDVGSRVPGTLADLTVLGETPVACDAAWIDDIPAIATVHDGRVFESPPAGKTRARGKTAGDGPPARQ